MEKGELENYIILEQIDFLPYIEKCKRKEVYELMDMMEDDFNNTPLVQDNKYLEGTLFNWINEVELIDYLTQRYPNQFNYIEQIRHIIV